MKKGINVICIVVFISLVAFITIGCASGPKLGSTTPLQDNLNAMPTILIGEHDLKFEFGGDTWTAKLNGENYLFGTLESLDTNDGSILTLKQTHEWRVANTGESVATSATNAAAGLAGGLLSIALGGNPSAAATAAGSVASSHDANNTKMWRKTSGPDIILEHRVGPPATLSVINENIEELQSVFEEDNSNMIDLIEVEDAVKE